MIIHNNTPFEGCTVGSHPLPRQPSPLPSEIPSPSSETTRGESPSLLTRTIRREEHLISRNHIEAAQFNQSLRNFIDENLTLVENMLQINQSLNYKGISLADMLYYALPLPFNTPKQSDILSLEAFCTLFKSFNIAYEELSSNFETRKQLKNQEISTLENQIKAEEESSHPSQTKMAELNQKLIQCNLDLLNLERNYLNDLIYKLDENSNKIKELSEYLIKILEEETGEEKIDGIATVLSHLEAYHNSVVKMKTTIELKKSEFDRILGQSMGLLEKFKVNEAFVFFYNFMKLNKSYIDFLQNPQKTLIDNLTKLNAAKEFAVKNPSKKTKEMLRDMQIAASYIEGDAGIASLRKRIQQDLILDALFRGYSNQELNEAPQGGMPKEHQETWDMVKSIIFMHQLKIGSEGSSNPLINAASGFAALALSSTLPNPALAIGLFYSFNTLIGLWEQKNFGDCLRLDEILSTGDEQKLLNFLHLMQQEYDKAVEFQEALNEMRMARLTTDIAQGKVSKLNIFLDATKECFLKIKLAKTWQEKALRIFLQIIVPATIFIGILAGTGALLASEAAPLIIAMIVIAAISGIGTELYGLIFGYFPKINRFLDEKFPETLSELENYKKIKKQKAQLEQLQKDKELIIEQYLKRLRETSRGVNASAEELRKKAEEAYAADEAALASSLTPAPLASETIAMKTPEGNELFDELLDNFPEETETGTRSLLNKHKEEILESFKKILGSPVQQMPR